MTQVSRRYISPSVQKRMYEILIKAVGKANNTNYTVHFLTDLLSSTERLMLAKRLAIAYLLLKGSYTMREISEVLKVSLTTVQKVSITLGTQGDGYRQVINSLVSDEKVENFMNKIADVITSVPTPGRDWKSWRKNKEVAKRKRSKAF